jgi:hypothetical protein
MSKKNICFWGVLILFVLLSCWWTTYFPYNREVLYRAIPMSSDVIIEQPGIHEHWQQGTIKDLILESLGEVEGQDGLASVLNESRIDQMLEVVASKNTLFARVPSLSSNVKPALVVATWAGGKGQFLKWASGFALKSKVNHKMMDYGIKVWSVDLGAKEPDYRFFSFAFYEGVLVGSLSHKPFGVDYVVGRMTNTRPMAPALSKHLKRDQAVGGGWFLSQSAKTFGSQVMSYSFKHGDAKSVSGMLTWEAGGPFVMARAVPGHAQHCGEAVEMLGELPGAALFTSHQFFEWQMISNDRKGKLTVLRKLIRDNIKKDTPVFMCLAKPEYSGRLRGFKVPSLLMGMKIKEPEGISELLSTSLDALNAAYKTNLIKTEIMLNGHKVYNVSRVTGSFFDKMGQREKPSVTVIGDWLIIASNRDVVEALIGMGAGEGVVSGVDFDKSAFAGWAHVESMDPVLVNMIAMNDLWALASNRSRRTEFRMAIEVMQYLLRGLEGVETCVMATEQDGKKTSLNILVK